MKVETELELMLLKLVGQMANSLEADAITLGRLVGMIQDDDLRLQMSRVLERREAIVGEAREMLKKAWEL